MKILVPINAENYNDQSSSKNNNSSDNKSVTNHLYCYHNNDNNNATNGFSYLSFILKTIVINT